MEEEKPVNSSMYFEDIPGYEMATVMKELIMVRLMGLRAKYQREKNLIQNMDVKSACGQSPVESGTPAYAHKEEKGFFDGGPSPTWVIQGDFSWCRRR